MSKYVPVLLGKNSEYVPVYPDADGNYYALRPDYVRLPSDTSTETSAEDFDELVRDDEDEELVADDMADDEADESYIEEETADFPTAQAKVSTRLYQPAPGGKARPGATARYVPAPYSPNGRSTPPSADGLSLKRQFRIYRRGIDYPSSYQGFIDDTYVRITTTRDHCGTKIALVFGNMFDRPFSKTRYYDLKSAAPGYENATIWFWRDGKNIQKTDIWPIFTTGGELFDLMAIKVQDGRKVKLYKVEIVLNGVVILSKTYNKTVSGKFPLAEDISKYRRKAIFDLLPKGTKSTVLEVACQELGKAWHPKYGGPWEKKNENKGIFYNKPWDWCSEFASWAIRQATGLDLPKGNLGNDDLARYFCGRCRDTDLNKLGLNRFITPNKEICLWDGPWVYSKKDGHLFRSDAKWAFVGNKVPSDAQYKFDVRKITLTYYAPQNPNYCSWKKLGKKVKPGYYVKMKRGTDDDGHSSLFVKWHDDFYPEREMNVFWALGGNQDDRVKLKIYNIHRTKNSIDGAGPLGNLFDIEGSREMTGIFWKASRHAVGKGGYQDGFGITDKL